MPPTRMPFDGSLKIRWLNCDSRPTVMLKPFLSENDEYRSGAWPCFIKMSNKGVVSGGFGFSWRCLGKGDSVKAINLEKG